MALITDNKERVEDTFLSLALNTIESLSGTDSAYGIAWAWKLQHSDDIPPLALINHILITKNFWESLDEKNRWLWLDYTSFQNVISPKPLHLVSEAKGVLGMRWITDGMLFAFKYAFAPLPSLQTNYHGTEPIPVSAYSGAFFVRVKNLPFIKALIASSLALSVETGSNISLTRLFENLEDTAVWRVEEIVSIAERMPVGKRITIDVRMPSTISEITLYRSMHIIEASNVWKPLK